MAGAWKLIIEDDAGKQIVVPFTRDVITIGRKEGNTIRLTERNVSRNHAKLSKDNGHVVIEDLGSFNGVKLNGDRIDGRVLVHEGDTIQIGDYHLALHAQDGARTANGHGAQGAPQAPAGARSTTAAHAPTADDDEFAGDTQRWEPPQGLQGLSVQTLPTQEDRAVQSDDLPPALDDGLEATARAPASQAGQGAQGATLETTPVRLGGNFGAGFGADNGDTERVSLDMLSSTDSLLDTMKSGAPSARVRDEVELEPTVRQAASPSPVSVPEARPEVRQATMPPPSPAPAPQPPASPAAALSMSAPTLETRPERPSPDTRAEARPGARAPSSSPAASSADARAVLEEQTEAVRPSPGAADETVPRLVVLNTIFAGSTFALRSAEAVVGRTEDNDITIEHKSVSRNHAKVVREGDRVRILDLKSANGVLVNNEEVEQAVLRSGDVVELGRVRMRFVPIGERFVVPPDEIERARIADRAGDDFENDSGTGVTNPVRKKSGQSPFGPPSASYDTFPAQSKPKAVYIALGVVIGLLLVVALIIFARRGDDAAPADAAAAVPATGTGDDARAAGDGDRADDEDAAAKGPDARADAKADEKADEKGDARDDVAAAVADDGAAAADEAHQGDDDDDDAVEAVAGREPRDEVRRRPRPQRKRVDIEKNLAQAEAMLPQRRFDDVVRLAREVIGSGDASGTQRDKAKKQMQTACAFAPGTKGCR